VTTVNVPEGLEPLREGSGRGNLTDQVYDQMIQLFIRGELRPGAVLSERQLCERLDASRTPIREALGRLEAEGLVNKEPNRGVTVKPFSTEIFLDMLKVRSLLEGEAAYFAAGNVPPARISDIRARLDALRAQSQPELVDIWNMDEALHGAIAEAAGNVVMAQMIADLRRRIHVFNGTQNRGWFVYDYEANLTLLDAIERGDAEGARTAMRQHIDGVRAAVIGRLSSRRA